MTMHGKEVWQRVLLKDEQKDLLKDEQKVLRKGELKDGDRICLVGFGAGLTYGGILTEWPRV